MAIFRKLDEIILEMHNPLHHSYNFYWFFEVYSFNIVIQFISLINFKCSLKPYYYLIVKNNITNYLLGASNFVKINFLVWLLI